MANIFAGFSGFGQWGVLFKYVMYGGLFLIVSLAITAMVLMLLIKLKENPVYELDLVTRRFKKLRSREKKGRSGKKYLYLIKLKKFLPKIQQEDKYIEGKKDVSLLLKDNNGLHHTLRLPKLEELKEWYKNAHGIDLDKPEEEAETESGEIYLTAKDQLKKQRTKVHALKVLRDVYLLPSPAEDVEWLADDTTQAKREFATEWWKSPMAVWGVTLALCAFTFIITIIITKKL